MIGLEELYDSRRRIRERIRVARVNRTTWLYCFLEAESTRIENAIRKQEAAARVRAAIGKTA